MEVAFIVRLTMASETGGNRAAGSSGVPQSINISSDSPSAISDSFGQSEATPGTKKNSDFFVRKLASIIINVLLIQTLTVSSLFFQVIPKVIVNPYPQGQRQQSISQQESVTFQSHHWCSHTYLPPLSLMILQWIQQVRAAVG